MPNAGSSESAQANRMGGSTMYSKSMKLSLALSVVMALSGLMASAAAASTHSFDSEIADTFVTGAAKTTQVLVALPGSGESVECSAVSIKHLNKENGEELVNDGTMGGTFKETNVYTEEKLNVRLTYETCVAIKGKEKIPVTVEMHDCYYAFESVTSETNHAKVTINCPEKGEITVKVTALNMLCVSIPAQTVEGANYSNTNLGGGSSRDFDIKMTLTGVKSKTTSICGNKEGKEGTYNGEVTFSGTNKNVGGSQTGIWVT
jgi:hypothetical protein